MLKMRGIRINGEIHTGSDLDLLFLGYDDEMPEPKTLTEDIIGANGIIDYTEHAGLLPKFSNRNPVFHFFTNGSKKEIMRKFEKLSRYHGQTVNIFLDDDRNFYYRGRATVIKGEAGVRWAYFDLAVNAFPYKLKNELTRLKFDFEKSSKFIVSNNTMPVKVTAKITSITDPNPSSSALYAVQFALKGKKALVRLNDEAELSFILPGGSVELEAAGGRINSSQFDPYNAYGMRFQLSFREGKF